MKARMRFLVAGAVLLLWVFILWAHTASAQTPGGNRSYVYQQLDYPNALNTFASDINAGGDVVGWYLDQNGLTHGFVWHDGAFRSIDYPGAVFSQARGIGPGGDIVGAYRRAGEPPINDHGFLLTADGEFFLVEYPGHTNTIAEHIEPDGTILGCYHESDLMGTMRAIVISADGDSFVDLPASMNNGSTPDSKQIIGWYTDMATGRTHAYVADNGVLTPFDVPDSTYTDAYEINPAGAIVGSYVKDGKTRGYVLQGGNVTTIEFPNATYTDIRGINPRGDVSGKFYDAAGHVHGFVARLSPSAAD